MSEHKYVRKKPLLQQNLKSISVAHSIDRIAIDVHKAGLALDTFLDAQLVQGTPLAALFCGINHPVTID